MPDAFGNETPQEVVARIRANRQDAALSFGQTGLGASPGGQAGQSLANIFGGALRKTLDTRSARKDEEVRLIEAGMSPMEARETAKKTVTRDFTAVRQAKQKQSAMQGANDLIERLTPLVGGDMARASGMRLAAISLREQGFATEATKLTLQADEIIKGVRNEREALLDVKSIRSKREADEAQTRQETAEGAGMAPLQKQQLNRETLEAKLDAESDPSKRASIQIDLDDVNQMIRKLKFITGSTETDLSLAGLTNSVKSKLQNSLVDSGNQLDLLGSIGNTYQPEFLTFFGQIKAGGTAFLEKFGVSAGPEAKAFLSSYSIFKRNSLDGLNRYIKLITGAQMSEAEADRLRKAFPDVEKDSATQFISKYVAVVQQIMAVRERASASLAGKGLDLLPADLKKGFGADLGSYMPSFEDAAQLSGLSQYLRDVDGGVDTPTSGIGVDASVQAALDAMNAISGQQ